jgi:FkbM family methyltransferase
MPNGQSGSEEGVSRDEAPRLVAERPKSAKGGLYRHRLSKYLRPVKIRSALRRRIFVRVLPRSVKLDERVRTEYVGTAYSGWPIPAGHVQRDWVVYCLGAGEEASFETELIRTVGCEVHSFDPTEASARHVNGLRNDRLHFHQYAIWSHDGMLPMYVAEAPEHSALSAANLQNTRQVLEMPCRTIQSIMTQLGHSHIDLLKYHVEGGEYEVFDPDDLRRWEVQVLIMSLFWTASPKRALRLIDSIIKQGYRPVASKGQSFTFIDERLIAHPHP